MEGYNLSKYQEDYGKLYYRTSLLSYQSQEILLQDKIIT